MLKSYEIFYYIDGFEGTELVRKERFNNNDYYYSCLLTLGL